MANNKQIVKRFFEEIWNKGQVDQLDQFLALDYQGYIPLVGKVDRATMRGAVGAFRKAFPDLHIEVQDIVEEGDKLAVRWVAVGTSKGDFMGLKATGAKQTIQGLSYIQLSNGAIARDSAEYDVALLLQGLGISLPAQVGADQQSAQP